jgi:flagellar biosynthesis/type III secretory pathway protein FliH
LSAVPAAHFLIDFGSDAAVVAGADVEPLCEIAATGVSEKEIEQRVEEAHARGLEAGMASAQEQIAAQLQEQKAAFEAELVTARAAWALEEGARLSELMTSAMAELETRIAEAAERVLRPFLNQAVREHAIAGLRDTLGALASRHPEVKLEVSGPRDLLDALQNALPEQVASVSFAVKDVCDVHVKAGASVIETRIADWLKQIEGAAA